MTETGELTADALFTQTLTAVIIAFNAMVYASVPDWFLHLLNSLPLAIKMVL